MDPLSVTASIVAIVQLTVKVSEGLGDAKDASADRKQFETTIKNASKLLFDLLSRMDQSSNDPWHMKARELGAKDGVIYQYRLALELLKDKISDGRGIQKLSKTLLWKYIKDDADGILLRTDRLNSLVQIALELDHFELSKAIESHVSSLQKDSNIIREGVGAIQQDVDRQKHHLVMAWLSSAAFPTQQADFIAHRQVDTGLWFLDSPEFNEWLQGQSKTLFCHGIPGAGKTMLAAIAVNHLHNCVETPDMGVAYLYCNYKRQADQNAPDLLAAILKQLVQDRPSMAQPLWNLYEHHEVRGTKLPLNDTLRILKSVLPHFSKVYIIIDALDECQDENGTQVELLKLCRSFEEQTDLHLMVTSRHIPEIADEFEGVPQLEVRASNADVKRYVVGRVNQLAKCVRRDGELQELVQNKIAEVADGMFLLAHMHFESLLRLGLGTKAKVIYALENLSKGSGALEAAYSEAILRIDNQPQGNRMLAKNALSWISYAQRPLTTGELCHALAVQPGDTELDPDDIPDIDDIISVCAGLVTIDKESQIVRLVHYTTQIYLVKIREEWHHDAQYHIASTCLSYLCLDAFASGSCTSDVEFERRLQQHEFLYYSAQYGEQHVAAVQDKLSSLAMVLLHNNNLIACATQTRRRASKDHERFCFSQEVTGLHLTVSFGLLHLSKQLLSSAQGEKLMLAEARDSYGQTPLMWAAQNGQLETVMLLLSIDDVNPNARDDQGQTPLMWAARNGHNDTVKQLLLNTNNANPYAEDRDGWTLLTWAVIGGSRDTVEMLLTLINFDLSETCNDGWTLFDYAAEGGKNGIVDLLLGLNKVEIRDYCSGLEIASCEGQYDTVMLLLNTDKFDPNARDTTGVTPLSWAVQNGYKDAVEQLLSTDRVDPDAKDTTGVTPLMWAVCKGCEDSVELLLSTGKVDLNANAKGDDTTTPLMFAVYLGHEGIVKLLLSTGKVDLNANAKGDDRTTPLMFAVYLGHEGIVKLLLSTNEAHPHVENDGILTLLKLAKEKGHKAIVELLESYSCDT